MNRIKIVLHSKYNNIIFDEFIVEVNKSINELEDAHNKLKSLGIDLSHEYDLNDDEVSDEFLQKIKQLGINPVKDCDFYITYTDDERFIELIENIYVDLKSWVLLWLHLAKTQLPDLKFNLNPKNEYPTVYIGG